MVRGRRKEAGTRSAGVPVAATIGSLLLDLRDALQRAERCRLALRRLGYSTRRWQEIVKDVNPELRFALRPQIIDAIVTYLQSVGEPVSRKFLVHQVHLGGAGPLQRIRQVITLNLRCGNLLLYPESKVGLPDWKKCEVGIEMIADKEQVNGV